MPITNACLNHLKCCLHKDGHIVIQPVLLKCRSNACKQCILDSKEEKVICYSCKDTHDKKELLNTTTLNRTAETLTQNFLTDLIDYIQDKIKLIYESVEGNSV